LDTAAIRGFYTTRRVLADGPEEAEAKAIEILQQEEKYKWLIDATRRKLGEHATVQCDAECIGRISWFRWHFFKRLPGFAFYSDEEEA
jgi:hypothetical protein